MKINSKLLLAILVIVIIFVVNIIYQMNKDVSAPLVVVEHEGEFYTTLESSYCWDDVFTSICVDTIDPKDFEYERSNAVVDAEINDEIYIKVPRDFDQVDFKIIVEENDIDNIYSFTLTSEHGNVTYHFYIK